MKKISNENLLAILILGGGLLLFAFLLVAGDSSGLFFCVAIAVTAITAFVILFRFVPQRKRLFAHIGLSIILCLGFAGSLALNTRAAFSFVETNVAIHLTVNASSNANSNSNSSVTVSGGTVTVTAKGYTTSGACSDTDSKDTVTITITNKGTATVTYDLTVDGVYKITGGKGLTLEPGASISGTVTSAAGASAADVTGTLTFSNVSPVSTGASVETTFANSSQGATGTAWSATVGGTYTVDGTAVTGDTTQSNPSDHEYALVATPASGYEFYGWMSANSGILSNSASYTYKGVEGSRDTIWPIFAKVGEAMYYLKDASPRLYYHTLNEAIAAAGSSGTIVVGRDGILPAGEYTIPAGVTLLVPFDDANTVISTMPSEEAGTCIAPSGFSSPKAFRTLTMADGAKITVNGTMSVPAKVIAGNSNTDRSAGRVSGGYGIVKMSSGSSITVESGGAISVFGYITGDGEVIANSGANVYESFQVADFRGGTATNSLNNKKQVFPLSQYYIQNIEVSLTLYSGAIETAYTALYMSDTIVETSLSFIDNSGAMFNLTSGNLVKRYDKATDRLIIDINGNLTVSNIKISGSVTIGVAFPFTVDSSNFALPINGNMTININSGTMTLEQDIMFLPGCEVNIGNGATLTATSGSDIFLYDLDEWKDKGYCYTNLSPYVTDFKPLYWSPDREYTRTAADLKDAVIHVASGGTLDATAGAFYTTNGGAAITGEEGAIAKIKKGSATISYQYNQTDSAYAEIPVTAPQLLNGDGSYAYTANSSTSPNTYTYTNGKWECATHSYTSTTTATCTDTGTTTYTCTVCAHSYAEDVEPLGHEYTSVVTAPTCTEKGFTTYTCSTCGHSYVDDEVAATGHSYTAVVTAPTCTAGGYTTYTCSVCGDSYTADETAATGHKDTEGATDAEGNTIGDYRCDNCGLVFFYATNVNLGNNLDMRFAFTVEALEAIVKDKGATLSNCYVVFTFDGKDSDPIYYSSWTAMSVNNVDCYAVTFTGFAAKNMCDYVTVTICANDGTPISVAKSDCIRDYAKRMLAAYPNSAKLQALIVDMLNYGAACQQYFANQDGITLTEDQLANYGMGTSSTVIPDDMTIYTPTTSYGYEARLITTSNILFQVQFGELPEGAVRFDYSFVNHWGITKGGQVSLENDAYFIEYLTVSDAQQEIVIALRDSDNNKLAEWSDSIASYCQRMIGSNDKDAYVYEAFLKFSISAYDYLHNGRIE